MVWIRAMDTEKAVEMKINEKYKESTNTNYFFLEGKTQVVYNNA